MNEVVLNTAVKGDYKLSSDKRLFKTYLSEMFWPP